MLCAAAIWLAVALCIQTSVVGASEHNLPLWPAASVQAPCRHGVPTSAVLSSTNGFVVCELHYSCYPLSSCLAKASHTAVEPTGICACLCVLSE
jgi:hypothetical protein